VVDLLPDTFLILPVVIANWYGRFDGRFALEILWVRESAAFSASLIHPSQAMFRTARVRPVPFTPLPGDGALRPKPVLLECGGRVPSTEHAHRGRVLTSATPDLIQERFPRSWEAAFPARGAPRLAVHLPPFEQTVVGLKITVPRDAKPGEEIRLHFVQRSLTAKRIVGGVAVQINVAKPGELRPKPREKTA
jgi:hypothetical protein